ncbi:class I SAM-dependent methyltransferase [Synechocystis sp. CS-94]|nr:class I SAM-dependent methyltransferase [Synechocystis sp. CS-94]
MAQNILPALLDHIRQSPQQRLTFAEFMEWVLYQPDYGYYSSGQVDIGIRGDFVTAIALGPDFGELLTEQFLEMWQRLGEPAQFDILELGAGTGAFAQTVLAHAENRYPQFFAALQYHIIEESAALRRRQAKLLFTWQSRGKVQWRTWAGLGDDSLVGCCFSNEFFDALPVHRVGIKQGILKEQYIEAEAEGLISVWDRLSTEKLVDYFASFGLQLTCPPYEEDYETEVNLAAHQALENIARVLTQGWVLTVDYGHPAGKYYHPQRRGGTLQCYFQQRHHDNPFVNLGQQDVTAHVNFTALEWWGECYGLTRLNFTQQGPFLMNLGLGDRLAALSNGQYDLNEIFSRRAILHQLIDPSGLGKFGVLLQGKALTSAMKEPALRGFITPTVMETGNLPMAG